MFMKFSIICANVYNNYKYVRFLLFVYFALLQSRPFGVSLLIAGHDENGPSL